MIKILFTILISTFYIIGTNAAVTPKNASRAMLNIYTYDAQGKLLKSGQAFFIDDIGNAVTAYSILKGANRAEVIDSKGNKYNVHRILGANSTTDIVKFSVENIKGNEFFSITENPVVKGKNLQLVRYTTDKKKMPENIIVNENEPYNDYQYYQISAKNVTENIASPLIDETGKIIAIVQENVSKDATSACAIDARFINDLKISATSSINSDLRAIGIAKALPSNITDATTYLYMMPQNDSLICLTAYNDFFETWSSLPDGYVNRGTWFANHKNYSACEKDFSVAFEKAKNDTSSLKSNDIHYSLSNLIYQTILQQNDTLQVPKNWTLARAEEEADKAFAESPYTLYLVQKGNCQFASKNYTGASESFLRACNDKKFVSAETYFSAARSLELANADSQKVLELLDSCINHIEKPISSNEAQYYLERSQRLIKAGRYRQAVLDYNEYEKAIGPKNLTDQFYYLREQAEMEAHMYQQALDDIRTAIATSNQPYFYRLEEAYILLRVGEFQSAIDAAKNLLKDLPENPDCYKIIGIAYGELKNKTLAQQNLLKAKQLGDTTVDSFIEKYK